jgi:hypothetical protein
MCCVLLETTMLCMYRTMSLKPNYVCVHLIICATSCICDQCITYLFVDQILMVLHVWIFFVSWPFLLLSCRRYGMHISEINNVKKKSKKTSIYGLFLSKCTPTGLSVVPISKPVIPTAMPISASLFQNVNSDQFSTGFHGNRSYRW